jgi:hypothetical protein
MATLINPLVDALYRTEEKAEIVDGKIVRLMATGRMPSYAAFELAVSLRYYIKQSKLPGIVVGDNAGFVVSLPNRSSFSPDAAYYVGPNSGMRFFEGAPAFAVEVRSENDYGVTAEAEMAAKTAVTISRREVLLSGMSICSRRLRSCENIRRNAAPTDPSRPSRAMNRRMPNLRFRAG